MSLYIMQKPHARLDKRAHSLSAFSGSFRQGSTFAWTIRTTRSLPHAHQSLAWHMPEAMVQLVSDITLRKTKAALIRCSHPTSQWKAFQVQKHAARGPKTPPPTNKISTPCSSYPKRIKWCFRDLGTKHHLYRHMSPVNHQLQFCCNQATLTCLGFSKLPLQLCAQLINRKQLVNPAKIQTLALRIKAGKNCFCFVFSENLFSLPVLPKKALDR